MSNRPHGIGAGAEKGTLTPARGESWGVIQRIGYHDHRRMLSGVRLVILGRHKNPPGGGRGEKIIFMWRDLL